MASGIYRIVNTVTGDFYVGSTKDLSTRKSHHFTYLRDGKHPNHHLQSVYNKHGGSALRFEILLTCDPSMLLWFEQQCIDKLKPAYNICPTAGNHLGSKRSEETKRKMSQAHTGKPNSRRGCTVSERTRRRISDAQKARWAYQKRLSTGEAV